MQRKPPLPLRFILGMILLVLSLSFPLPSRAEEGGTLTVIHTNDLHSHLQGFAPENDYSPLQTGNDRTVGGWARIATVIKREKVRGRNALLVLDGGDAHMGSLFHLASREEAFELRLMRDMGYDVLTLGNHEFDLRPAGLARIIQAAKARGGLPEIVCANIRFSADDPRDAALRRLADRGAIKPYTVITRGGMRIGIFGIMGRDAAAVAPFAAPVRFRDPREAAKDMVQLLREREKAEVVICLSHGGWNRDKSRSEDELLAENVPGIDIIIGGHTHTALTRPIITPGGTLIVQAGAYGMHAGILTVRRVKNGVALHDYRLIAIDDSLPGDAATQRKIETYRGIVDRDILRAEGLSARRVIARTAFDLVLREEESNLGNLIADSIRWYANRHGYDPRDPATKVVVALESNGVIRDDILKGRTGNVTVADAFRAVPLGVGIDGTPGYPLIACYLTAREIKKMIEIVTSVYPRKGPTYFLQISGLTFAYNPHRMIFDRVTDIRIGSAEEGYTPLDYSAGNKKLYRVAANLYNAAFLTVVGDYTGHLLDIVPKDRHGSPVGDIALCRLDADRNRDGIQEVKEWTGLIAYLQSLPDTDGDGIGEIPQQYRGQQGRITHTASLDPRSLIARPGTTTRIALAGAALLLLISCGLAAFLLRKRRTQCRGQKEKA